MQYFYIRQGSTLNTLRMELVKDGRYDFMKASHFDNALQNADITFTMKDENDNGNIAEEGVDYETGDLILPIYEPLAIVIK